MFTRTGTVDAVVVPAWFLGEADALAAIGAELGDVPVVVVHVDPYERDAVHASARPRNWVVLDRPGQSLEVVGP